jgi:alkanesulfonate monooxygenase SsuD/methylene tetrahydromethanopterin reductase-like flavin-dependent oxidoreductase (luciferase family)
MKVGIALPQSDDEGTGGTWTEILSLARQAEDGGVDSLWVSDHFFFRPKDGGVGSEIGSHEAWTLLTALAASTTSVELGTLVLATSFRPPGLLAKMAATADDVAAGRLILGLGCGWHEPEYAAFGYPFDHRVSRFEESLRIIVPLVRGDRVTLDGRWTSVRDAVILPSPIRADLPILIAATGERMLGLTARFADQWQTAWFGMPDDRYRRRHEDLLAACDRESRDPSSLAVTVGISVEERPDAPALALDAGAIAEGLSAWDREGADHVQLAVNPSTAASFEVVLAGIRRWRDGSTGPAMPD